MKVIITGSTGMVGEAVLIECLAHPQVSKVAVINRSSLSRPHPKLEEIIIDSYEEIPTVKNLLSGYDACFHCMGTSAVGKSEEEYHRITFELTKILVDVLYELNPEMVVTYVSGDGTDSSEKGSTMWARVKGKTENYILTKGFKDAYMFRAGAIIPEKGVKSKTTLYNILYVLSKPFYPLLKKINSITTSSNVGLAMIHCVIFPQAIKHLQNEDINAMAKKK